jgi:hypothetical protein
MQDSSGRHGSACRKTGRAKKAGRHDGSAVYAVRAGKAVPTVQGRQAVFKVRSDRQGRQAW